jgi:prefoldin subunit 5
MYVKEVLNGIQSPPAAGAKEVWKNYNQDTFIQSQEPEEGDVVVWGGGTYGHIAIFVNGTKDSFNSFDQNYPVGSLPHIQYHTGTNVLGFLRPKGGGSMNPLNYKLQPNEWVQLGVQNKPIDHTKTVGELIKDLGLRYDIIADLNKSVGELTASNTELQNAIETTRKDAEKVVSTALQDKNSCTLILANVEATLASTKAEVDNLQAQANNDRRTIIELHETIQNLNEDGLSQYNGWKLIKLGIAKVINSIRG